jgi:hypothetical protein
MRTGGPSVPPEQLLRSAAADPLDGAQRAAVDVATELPLIVWLVCGYGNGRSGVEPRRFRENRERLLNEEVAEV